MINVSSKMSTRYDMSDLEEGCPMIFEMDENEVSTRDHASDKEEE
jgi:hypothetical protein